MSITTFSIALVMFFGIPALAFSDEGDPDEPSTNVAAGTFLMKDFKPDLLLRYKLPDESTETKDAPTLIETQFLGKAIKPPFRLQAFVLVPIEQACKITAETKVVRLPFGAIDVVSPLAENKIQSVFPYEEADDVRKGTNPGDIIFIGVEAVELRGAKSKLEADFKVNRLQSW